MATTIIFRSVGIPLGLFSIEFVSWFCTVCLWSLGRDVDASRFTDTIWIHSAKKERF